MGAGGKALFQRLVSVCPFTSEIGPRLTKKKLYVSLPILIITLVLMSCNSTGEGIISRRTVDLESVVYRPQRGSKIRSNNTADHVETTVEIKFFYQIVGYFTNNCTSSYEDIADRGRAAQARSVNLQNRLLFSSPFHYFNYSTCNLVRENPGIDRKKG